MSDVTDFASIFEVLFMCVLRGQHEALELLSRHLAGDDLPIRESDRTFGEEFSRHHLTGPRNESVAFVNYMTNGRNALLWDEVAVFG